MLAETLVQEIAGVITAIGFLLTAILAVCKSLKLKRTVKTLEAVTGAIEAFNPNEQSIDEEGTVTIDPKKNLKRDVATRTQELNVADILDGVLKK